MDWKDALQGLLADAPAPATEPAAEAPAPGPTTPAPGTRLDIILDRKGRRGKTATIIAGFPDHTPDADIAALASALKQALGCGGSARGGEILIQGDRRADADARLRAMGYTTRLL